MQQMQPFETSYDRHHSYWAPVDRYQPCFELASGGMATVYLARVTARAGFDRFVALKRIHPHLVKEPGFAEMFLDEAHVASRIVHPHVCSVYDYEAEGDRYYIAMEYLMGEPLSRVSHVIESQVDAPSVERGSYLIARIIADACEGLHAAHELRDSAGDPLNVVHRDVTPQNLFLTYDGAVKVVDFGLVRSAQCLHKTKTGIVKGKFGYLAPEILATKPLDRRADIWGLGVVLWELVTRRRLFLRDSEADTILAVANADIPPPSVACPGVPPALDAIVLRAVTRNPAERYATARDLGRDLTRFLHQAAEPVGMSDLAEWMDRLFVGGRARKLQLLEMASQLGSDLPTVVGPRYVRAGGAELASDSSPLPTRAMTSPSLPPTSLPPKRLDDTAARRTARPLRWPMAMTTSLAVLALTALLAALTYGGRIANGAASANPSKGPAAIPFVPYERAPSQTEIPLRASVCGPEHGSYILEVVPTGEGDAHPLVLRAVPH
jgi:serine/threonine-protein kinase